MKKYADTGSVRYMRFKAVLSLFIMLSMIVTALGLQPVQPVRAENNLEEGMYPVLISPSEWHNGAPKGRKCIDISDRIVLTSDDKGKVDIAFTVNGYSKYEAIYMVKQDKNDVIDVLFGGVDYSVVIPPKKNKIATNWTSFDGTPLTGYDQLDKYKDESLNDCFVKLDKPDEDNINEKTDTATFIIYNVDIDKKIGLVGYSGKFLSEDQSVYPSDYVSNVSIEINRNDFEGKELCYLAEGYSMGEDPTLYPVFTSYARKDKNTINIANLSRGAGWKVNLEDKISKVEYELDPDNDDAKVLIKLTLTEEYKATNPEIKKIVERKSDAASLTEKYAYQGYLVGKTGVVWSENLYNKEKGIVELPLSSGEFLNGVKVLFGEEGAEGGDLGNLCFVDKKMDDSISISDDDTGISYESFVPNIHAHAKLNVASVNSGYLYEDFQKKAVDGKFKVFSFSIEEDGKTFIPKRDGRLLIPIPEDWDPDNFYAVLDGDQSNYMWPNFSMAVVEIDSKKYFEYKDRGKRGINLSCFNNDCNNQIAIGEVKQKIDVSALSAGVYKVEPDFLKYGGESQGSMAGGTLQKEGYLVIGSDGSKEVYLNFKSITMDGMEAHMATLWNKTDVDVEHFDYVVDAGGALLSNAEFNPNTEFACLKAAKVKLWDDTYDSETRKYHFFVIPPAMGAGQPFEDVYNNPIDVDLVFYKAEKLEGFDINTIPTFQKSVLRRSVDKAESLKESDYTADSYAKLKSAFTAGKTYYQSLGANDAGADKAISKEIKEKSGAIEKAYKELVKNTNPTPTPGSTPTPQPSTLDIKKLENGEYTIRGDMLRVNKKSKSMADGAINHDIKLTVDNGDYTLTIRFHGMKYLGRFGYLQKLEYFKTGYTANSFGVPEGELEDVTVDSYHKDNEGNLLTDEYSVQYPGGYPKQVTFELIPEAKDDGYVPLQVFVPVMEALGMEDNNPGMGTQQAYLKLDLKSIREGAPGGSGGSGGGAGGEAADDKKDEKKAVDNKKPVVNFIDISNHWAKASIEYVVEKNLFKGTNADKFEPEANMTRGMVVTVLHRLAGTPDASAASGLTDVKAGAWYASAVDWAVSQNVVKGVGEGRFAPNDAISREAFVTMIYNYSKVKNPQLGSASDISKFSDAGDVSEWASEAMKWAFGSGLVSGNDKGQLLPKHSITRAEVATIFERYLKSVQAAQDKADKAKAADKK